VCSAKYQVRRGTLGFFDCSFSAATRKLYSQKKGGGGRIHSLVQKMKDTSSDVGEETVGDTVKDGNSQQNPLPSDLEYVQWCGLSKKIGEIF